MVEEENMPTDIDEGKATLETVRADSPLQSSFDLASSTGLSFLKYSFLMFMHK